MRVSELAKGIALDIGSAAILAACRAANRRYPENKILVTRRII